jgi:hypothetical protein
MFKWIFRTLVVAAAAWGWRTYRARRAEERALAAQ